MVFTHQAFHCVYFPLFPECDEVHINLPGIDDVTLHQGGPDKTRVTDSCTNSLLSTILQHMDYHATVSRIHVNGE